MMEVNVTNIVDEVKELCRKVKAEVEFMEHLAGSAGKDGWPIVDPGYAWLKEMTRTQGDIVVARAQALRDAIPD